jgi:hypothetical protein
LFLGVPQNPVPHSPSVCAITGNASNKTAAKVFTEKNLAFLIACLLSRLASWTTSMSDRLDRNMFGKAPMANSPFNFRTLTDITAPAAFVRRITVGKW